MITDNLSILKINKLSQEKYDREYNAENLETNSIYLTPDTSILYTSQLLTNEQKAQARENIGVSNVDNIVQSVNTLPVAGVNGQIVFLKEINSQYGNGTTANLTVSESYYATEKSTSWNSYTEIYSGNGTGSNGVNGNYRSKIVFSTDNITISSSSKLVVKIIILNNSSPMGCMGILTTNANIAPSSATSALRDSAIATSYAYTDEDKSDISGTNLAGGSSFYFVFDTNEIVANATYYLYLVRTTDHYSGSGWVEASRNNVELILTYNDGASNGAWHKLVPYIYEA